MYLIPQPLVLAPPRDYGLLYAVYVDSEEILRYAQHDMKRQNDERTKRRNDKNDNVAVNPSITFNPLHTHSRVTKM